MTRTERIELLERAGALLVAEACGEPVSKEDFKPYKIIIAECVLKHLPELERKL